VKRLLVLTVVLSIASPVRGTSARRTDTRQLTTTNHPTLSRDASALWLVPAEQERRRLAQTHDQLADAVDKFAAADYAGALPLATRAATVAGPLQDYAKLYQGLSQLRLGKIEEGRRILDPLRESKSQGYLTVAAGLAAGEAAEGAADFTTAMAIYETLANDRAAFDEEILMRLGRAALAAGDRKKAAAAYQRVFYELPLTDSAPIAAERLQTLQDQIERSGYKADFNRANILYGARRYTDAGAAFQAILAETSGDDREVADLRIAECDFFLRRYQAASERLKPYLEQASRRAEARFFYLSALRESGRDEEYIALTKALVADFPDSSWSEEALNNLGTFYILENEDELAAQTFAELFKKFPSGARSERAAWKAGWWSYKNADYANTIRVFEDAATVFPRSDYRPSFLYWAARAHAKLDRGTEAVDRLRIVHADYRNSYYGRLAQDQLARAGDPSSSGDRAVSASRQPGSVTPVHPPTEARIRALLGAGLYGDALSELRYAQRAWGGSPAIDATIAWAYHRKGELRRAITIMRRAYPQFLASGGHELPTEILQVIFPLTYWDSIRKHSEARGLDPYLVAALIAQESTFDPKVRSAANAWGLMQIVPATGRRLARTLNIRGFTTSKLTDADINIRMGTLYFSQLARQFGGTHYALASYNAGESRVVRWKAERPGLDEDEFIDDIPFPETQNYVKRILGTAEDYRRLYGEAGGRPIPVSVAEASAEPPPTRAKAAASTSTAKAAPRKAVKKPAARRAKPRAPQG
jgi:soluble lytic murein transglycosylase